MNADDLKYQAVRLRWYVQRGGSAERWFESKGFSLSDARAIKDLAARAERDARVIEAVADYGRKGEE